MEKPNTEDILKPLKPFQRRTVEHAFHRLFKAKDSTARFLVADEVGLGKTLVARGIIARTIEHLWHTVERIDIVYICSNHSIARANLPKLQIGTAAERSFALATRLTMLATELATLDGESGLAESKLNFISFTPGTSFKMGQSKGQWSERAVLYHLLQPIVDQNTALKNLLQGSIRSRESWRNRLRKDVPIEHGIRSAFETSLAKSDLSDKLDAALNTFWPYRESWPDDARRQRDEVIVKLRQLLAEVCVQALEPDLVIFDEFQRFKPLLETREIQQDAGAELAQALFRAETPEGNPVRTLLLSATPYKLYTSDAEIADEEHYSDFLATMRFLLNGDDSRVKILQSQLAQFGGALKRATAEPHHTESILDAKHNVETALRTIMVRTERVPATEERDAMVEAHERDCQISPVDVRQYLASDALFRAVGSGDPMPFWKSAPYLAHFMHGYKVSEQLDEALKKASHKVRTVVEQHTRAFLQAERIRIWSEIEPANAKLRDMVGDLLDGGLWRLLWIPPSLPYWSLEGPFKGMQSVTKTLMFSAWNVVPDAVSAILSYEAERRMVGTGRVKKYEEPRSQQGELLRFTQSESVVSRHRLLWLLMPCLPLADRAHPLDAPNGKDRRDWVRERIGRLLAELPDPKNQDVDRRWEWAVSLLLDPALRDFLKAWSCDELTGLSEDQTLPKPDAQPFRAHVEDVLALDISKLGARPPGLAELLTEVALGSPAILASRCLKTTNIDDQARRRFSVEIAQAFWSLFNQPAVISLIRQLSVETDTGQDEAYWRQVLRYCQQGNLQAVLDEQWHLLWEQHAWSERDCNEEIAAKCSEALVQVAPPTRSRVHVRLFANSKDDNRREEIRLRTIFAQRFGRIRTEDDREFSQDAVRRSFNSPFRPFVLASTSIGQEGLDFHPWCRRLVHWDLPGNPVDLEQREGRVHRYKGHALRCNVVATHGQEALTAWQMGDDIWTRIFELAERHYRDGEGKNGLIPYWIAPGDCRVERHVPMLAYTKEVEAFNRLKRQLAAYRVVLGQPRQEELVTLLEHANLDSAKFGEWTVDLSPP